MERELTKTQNRLVRLWMFGPIFAVLAFLAVLCVLATQPLGTLLFMLLFVPVICFLVRDLRYRYFAPRLSNFIDLAVTYAIFAAICYGVEYWSWGNASLTGAMASSLVWTFFFAPHILFRGVRISDGKTPHPTA